MSIWVCGEVLIDILPSGPVVGGGPQILPKLLRVWDTKLISLMEFLAMLMVLLRAKS